MLKIWKHLLAIWRLNIFCFASSPSEEFNSNHEWVRYPPIHSTSLCALHIKVIGWFEIRNKQRQTTLCNVIYSVLRTLNCLLSAAPGRLSPALISSDQSGDSRRTTFLSQFSRVGFLLLHSCVWLHYQYWVVFCEPFYFFKLLWFSKFTYKIIIS